MFDEKLIQSFKNEKYRRDIRKIPGFSDYVANGTFQIFQLKGEKFDLVSRRGESVRIVKDSDKDIKKDPRCSQKIIELIGLAFLGRSLEDRGEIKFKDTSMNIDNSNYTDLVWMKEDEIEKTSIIKKEIPPLILIQQKFTEGYKENRRWRCLTDLYPKYLIYEDQDVTNKKNHSMKQDKLICGHKSIQLDGMPKIRLHELIAIAYLGKPSDPIYKYVIHIDPTKDENGQYINNHYSNLKWWYEPEVLDPEEWLDHYSDSDYKIGTNGEIKSFKSGVSKFRKQQTTEDGYKIFDNGEKKENFNRVMEKTFRPGEINSIRSQVHHKNSIRNDNSIDNLTATTPSANSKARNKPKKPPSTKPIIQMDKDGNFIREFKSAKEVIEILKLEQTERTIRKWAADEKLIEGFKWSFRKYIPKPGEIEVRIVGDFDGYVLNFPDHVLYSSGVVVNTKNGYIISLNRDIRYPKITLTHNGNVKKFFLHRLLALFFVPGRTEEKWMVNHKNGIRDDYRLENLEWCTPSENTIHGIGKPVLQLDLETGNVLNRFKCISDAVEFLGKGRTNKGEIAKVCEGVSNSAHGFDWEWDEK